MGSTPVGGSKQKLFFWVSDFDLTENASPLFTLYSSHNSLIIYPQFCRNVSHPGLTVFEWCILSLGFTFLSFLFPFLYLIVYHNTFFISFYAGFIFNSEIFTQLQNWNIITWFSKSKITGATGRHFPWKGEILLCHNLATLNLPLLLARISLAWTDHVTQ